MKKFVVLLFALLLVSSVALADVDLSGMSYDELVALKDQINLAMWQSEAWQEVTVPQGLWEVGVDIPAGHWTITAADGAYCIVSYGDELEENGVDIAYSKYRQYHFLTSPTSYLFDADEDISSVSIDMNSGFYVQIDRGNTVFSPYSGKPSLEFSSSAPRSVRYLLAPTASPSPVPESYDPDYPPFDYASCARHPEDHIGKNVMISGRVVQVLGSRTDGYGLRVSTSGDYGDIVYLHIAAANTPSFNILVDDRIVAYSKFTGDYTYKTVSGGEMTIPSAYVYSVILGQ